MMPRDKSAQSVTSLAAVVAQNQACLMNRSVQAMTLVASRIKVKSPFQRTKSNHRPACMTYQPGMLTENSAHLGTKGKLI